MPSPEQPKIHITQAYLNATKSKQSDKENGTKTTGLIIQGGPKHVPTRFCQNFVISIKVTNFGTQMAKTIKLCEVDSMPTSPNLCQRVTV